MPKKRKPPVKAKNFLQQTVDGIKNALKGKPKTAKPFDPGIKPSRMGIKKYTPRPVRGPLGPAAAAGTGLAIGAQIVRSAGRPGAGKMSILGGDAPVYQTPFNDVTPEQQKKTVKKLDLRDL